MYCNEYNTSKRTAVLTTRSSLCLKGALISVRNYELLGRYVQTKVQEAQGIVGELHTGPFSAPNWLAAGGRSCTGPHSLAQLFRSGVADSILQYLEKLI